MTLDQALGILKNFYLGDAQQVKQLTRTSKRPVARRAVLAFLQIPGESARRVQRLRRLATRVAKLKAFAKQVTSV